MNPAYLFIHPFIAASSIFLLLLAYSYKAGSNKRHTPHYYAGWGAFLLMTTAEVVAILALRARTAELGGDFPQLFFTFTYHFYLAITLYTLVIVQVTLGSTMHLRKDLLPRLRRWHWWNSQALMLMIFLIALMGVPVFYDLLEGRAAAQGFVIFATIVFLIVFIRLYIRLARDATEPIPLKKIPLVGGIFEPSRQDDASLILVNYIPDERAVRTPKLATILQTSLRVGIPHTHVCGGNARCSTCRVAVLEGMENVLTRNALEKKLADRLKFPDNIRLACQTRLIGPVTIRRLVLDEIDIAQTSQLKRDEKNAAETLGQEKMLAILFADIRGFTSFAERVLPYDVIHALNRYYYSMNNTITRHGGMINNTMGDGFLALFGLDEAMESPLNAVRAGLELLDAMEELDPYFSSVYGQPLDIGIGVHYGEVVIGDLGTEQEKRLSAIGDSVNYASRIENANKESGTRLLISEELYLIVKDDVIVGEQIPFNPKGISGQHRLYEITGLVKQNA